MPGFDYSKWDKLELSDDEDSHPGAQFIEADSLRRIKRHSHQEKALQRKQKELEIKKQAERDEEAKRSLELQLGSASASDADEVRAKLKDLEVKAAEREDAMQTMEREATFDAEEFCQDAWSHSLVGKACSSDSYQNMDYDEFVAAHKKIMDKYIGSVRSNDDNMSFMEENTFLLHEHALGYMLLEALDRGMKEQYKAMRRIVKQKFHIKSLLDFAETTKKDARSAVRPFFKRLSDDEEVAKDYEQSFETLYEKLVERAKEKVKEEAAAAEMDAEELSREDRLGPGGLDPVEVFETLPMPMQEAYQNQDVQAMRDFVDQLPLDQARLHMRRMVDSGLWVPEPGSDPGIALRDD
eukprot:CAMPEP_0170135002 /NCGR_PEP_ID=MMETSP0033_2-20121228/2243_1 /TAXON_ID=195969 /ORGANISM="Dolichomastix tenuilepis, Strain CCMP3274" /LENGTH=352 /DNA_ID=CAMNT_0010370593 /DNA_START=22 /DNA_END=1080 /DNA_ORIENTATION=+